MKASTSSSHSAATRAVVLGASMAGLLAARVLSERFSEVVVLERDELPAVPAPRKGTPHAVHPHGLLARGREVLEQLFPGFTETLVARGALLGDLQRDADFFANAQRFADGTAGHIGLCASRLAIEHELRCRVLALPNVRLIDGVDVHEPVFDRTHSRVKAARYAAREGDTRLRELSADLTVDCTGRATRASQWLAGWGFEAPAEEQVDIGICYASAYFERSGAMEFGRGVGKSVVICAATPGLPRPGVLIAQEPDASGTARWVVAVGGYAGDHPTATIEGMRQRALELGSADITRVTHDGRMLGPVQRYVYPHSLRRRYERLGRFPGGLLLLGDSMTTFNPIFGQGMSVAACEALSLQTELARGDAGLARRYFKAVARVIDTPWQLAVGGDLAIATVPGPRPLPLKIINAYVARVQRAARHDPVVGLAFLRVAHLLAAPPSLFAPRIFWRVMLKGGSAAAAPEHGAPAPGDPAVA